jgi:hypothetical protein
VERLNSHHRSTNRKETNQIGLKRRIKPPKKRGKDELVKNKMNTRLDLHKTNPGGHKVVTATIPAAISHNSLKLWTSLSQAPKGRGKPSKDERKCKWRR